MLKSESFWPLTFLLLATFFKGLVWISIVPIWHTPDEQAHFATIQYKAEGLKPSGKTHSEELLISERFLGTERGSKRVNKFTFNPEYKIEYILGPIGKHEDEIKRLDKETRKNLLEKEAGSYYPLYYQIGILIYKIFYHADLFVRVYAIRLFSLLPILGTTFFAFLTARQIFPKEKYLHLTIPILVSFQPMITFVNSGVSIDGLNIFLFTAFLYFAVLSIKRGLNTKNLIAISLILGLGQITKPQFLVAVPLFSLIFIYDLFAYKRGIFESVLKILIFIPIMFLAGGWFTFQKALGNFFEAKVPLPYYETGNPQDDQINLSLFAHLKNSLIKTDQETFYWYWGVFKWLSLVYPKVLNQILKAATVVALVGFFFWLLKIIREKDFSKEKVAILFLFFSAIFFAFFIFFVDWRHILTNGFSLGVQGRYFLPTVLSHVLILAIGILVLIPQKFKNLASFLLSLSFIVLNFFALYWLLDHYYYLSRGDFLDQASQYKPAFFKPTFLIIYLVFYFSSLFALFWQFIKYSFFKK